METPQALDSICLFAKRIFEDDNSPQNYLVFQQVDKCFKIPTNNDIVLARKSKTFSNESYELHQIIVLIQGWIISMILNFD